MPETRPDAAAGCPFAAAASPSAACPHTGAAADQPAPEAPAPRRALSRRSLLKLGLLAATPLVHPASAAAGAKKTPKPTPTPTPTPPPTPTGNVVLGGTPKWGHAVGDPRGTDIAVKVGKTKEGRFGVMFKTLDPYAPPDALLADLATQMVDPRPPLDDVSLSNDGFDNPLIPAGFIYFGQFVDHDMTRDTTPLSLANQDPHAMTNFDTAQFDLGSVYGRGPALDPQLYDPANPNKLRLTLLDNGLWDLPRAADGTAFVGDPRNDENLIICQMQIAFLRLHNAFVDQGMSFAAAQQQTRFHYQWIIVNDYLPRICGQDVVNSLLVDKKSGVIKVNSAFYKPGNKLRPMMPIEYSGAAYRYGHSMIRAEYEVHEGRTVPIFGTADYDLRGSRCLPSFAAIDWNYFFEIEGMEEPDDRNYARMIDTKLSLPLSTLPPTVVAPTADAILALAERNLLRGKRLGLAAGQDVAKAMGIAPLSNDQLGLTDPGWGGKAPLWFYVLKESELAGGRKLGPVGARIVAEVILGIMGLRNSSYFNATSRFTPMKSTFRMGDLLRFAGAV